VGDAMPRGRFCRRQPLWRPSAGVLGPGAGSTARWWPDRPLRLSQEKTFAKKPPKLSQPTEWLWNRPCHSGTVQSKPMNRIGFCRLVGFDGWNQKCRNWIIPRQIACASIEAPSHGHPELTNAQDPGRKAKYTFRPCHVPPPSCLFRIFNVYEDLCRLHLVDLAS
jgi:hypothetical protein